MIEGDFRKVVADNMISNPAPSIVGSMLCKKIEYKVRPLFIRSLNHGS